MGFYAIKIIKLVLKAENLNKLLINLNFVFKKLQSNQTKQVFAIKS